MRLKELLTDWMDDKIADVELHNEFERLTKGFQPDLLLTLINDLKFFLGKYILRNKGLFHRKGDPEYMEYSIPEPEVVDKPPVDWSKVKVYTAKELKAIRLNGIIIDYDSKYSNIAEIKPSKEIEWEDTPFPSKVSLEAFQYLRANWKLDYNSKYAYIFNLLQREYGGLVLDNYTDWLKRYGIKKRIQPDKAYSEDRIKELREKYEEYLKQKK